MTDIRARLRQYQIDASPCTQCRDDNLLCQHTDGRWARPLFTREPTGLAGVLVIAEAPNLGDTFDPDKGYLTYDIDTDPTGRFARMLLQDVAGLDVADIVFTNAVLCLPAKSGDGKFPVKSRQLELCRPWLTRLIADADPRFIVTFGAAALDAMRRISPHKLKLATHAGMLHAWHGRQLLPLYHPGQLGRIARPAHAQVDDMVALRRTLGRRGFPPEGRFAGPLRGERCGMTKKPGYGDKPWHTVVTMKNVSAASVSYQDHLYAQGVQDLESAGLALPPDDNGYLRIWDEHAQRRVDFQPLTWEFVREKVMPGLHFAARPPTSLDEFLTALDQQTS